MKKGQGIVLLETPRLLMRPTNVFCVLGKFNPMVLDLLENLLGLLWEAMLATQLMSVQ
jgi:hypothetical protein